MQRRSMRACATESGKKATTIFALSANLTTATRERLNGNFHEI